MATKKKKVTAKKAAKPAEAKVKSAAPVKKAEVRIAAAKGRPMLTWVGKRPLTTVTAFPAQAVESFAPAGSVAAAGEAWRDWPSQYPKGGLLFHGDNKEVLAHLLANGFRGKVNLIYIDPPFDSGADYVRKVALRGATGSAKLAGETYTLGEQIQYTDIWANDNYLQFMYERLLILKSLLSDDCAIFLHCDWKRTHLLRCLLDEVFGSESFRNEIIRVKCNPKNSKRKAFGNIHDCVLFYCNGTSEDRTWNMQRDETDTEDVTRLFSKVDPRTGRRYTTVALHARGTRSASRDSGKPWRGLEPPPGRHWAYLHSELDRFDAEGHIEWSSSGNPRLIRYADEKDGDLVQDIWTMKDPDEDEYPTEKPEELIDRVIRATTNHGDLVLDCFGGSGTTAAVAQKLGRRWIACDINKGAIQTTSKRLQGIISEQIAAHQTKVPALPLGDSKAAATIPPPAQSSFSVWRVNDYDLAIQHNEAVNLACEHIGVERTRGDGFFDGTQGKKLVKVIPFGHPLTPLDCEEIKRELDARPEEDRAVLVVCLGMELAAGVWLEEWNRLRKGKDAANRIEVIELRTDQRYGAFIRHEPARARVTFGRSKDQLKIEITDFISPSILERLRQQSGVVAPKIDDWRAMVDSVMIDTAYDGKLFNVVVADIPEKKSEYVRGAYALPAPVGQTTIAIKITDMLGEEVLICQAL